ncbi:phosphoglycerate mutase-like protein AT74 [Glycine soja]|uniref:phosphoglycerate mutase-like protein AT74 n=1 Tax=Glycine soja TaxID=3848 RepID=UPI00103943B7|nr:phosphoglycerate mutase-like protein AT74 [Glycine soja]
MIDVLPKGRILMQHRESQGNRDTTTYTTIPDHNIQSTAQSMAQALPTNEHLHREIGNDDCSPDWRVQFYVSPYVRTQSTLCDLRRCLLKKRIISVREESRIRERDFENFQVKREMKINPINDNTYSTVFEEKLQVKKRCDEDSSTY